MGQIISDLMIWIGFTMIGLALYNWETDHKRTTVLMTAIASVLIITGLVICGHMNRKAISQGKEIKRWKIGKIADWILDKTLGRLSYLFLILYTLLPWMLVIMLWKALMK